MVSVKNISFPPPHMHTHIHTLSFSLLIPFPFQHLIIIIIDKFYYSYIIGDEIARILLDYSNKEQINRTTSDALRKVSEYFVTLEDYRNTEVKKRIFDSLFFLIN